MLIVLMQPSKLKFLLGRKNHGNQNGHGLESWIVMCDKNI